MKYRLQLSALAVTSATLLTTSLAQAQGTASSPSTVHVHDPSSDVFWVGGPNDSINGPAPYPIDLDASGGPWRKQFYSSPTAGFGGGGTFREVILNAGNEPWTDWHEINANLGSHGAIWGTSSVIDVRIDGTSISYATSVTGGNTLNIDNFSQPVLPGQVLEIDKQFEATTEQFVGPNTLVYTLLQYPTTTIPEPACIASALAGLALLAMSRVRT